MACRKRVGDSVTCTSDRRDSKRWLWLAVKRGQCCAPGMMSASSANIWQPLHTPRPKVSPAEKKSQNRPPRGGLEAGAAPPAEAGPRRVAVADPAAGHQALEVC